jgi:hypothetical protein
MLRFLESFINVYFSTSYPYDQDPEVILILKAAQYTV